MHQYIHCLQMERSEIPHDPCQLGVPSGASKRFSSLSYIKISTISKWGELSLEPSHLGVPSGASNAISEPMVRFGAKCAPILHRHLHCLQTERSEIQHDPCHLGVPSGASKRFSRPWHVRCKSCTYLSSRLALSPNRPSFRLRLVT